MFKDQLVVNHGAQDFIADPFDFVDLVRRAEAIEEVQEGHSRAQRSRGSNHSAILRLLHGAAGKHSKTSRTACHHILMVTKNREGLG